MPAQRLIGTYDTTVLLMLELSVELERFWFPEPARTFVLIFIPISLKVVCQVTDGRRRRRYRDVLRLPVCLRGCWS
jgi:hypothetical protein